MEGLLSSNLLSKASIFGSGGSNIKSIQGGTTTLTSTSLDVAISSVDPNSSVLLFGFKGNLGLGYKYFETKGKIVDATTINFSIYQYYGAAGDVPIYWQVIEFNNVKSIQKGDYSLAYNTGVSSVDISVTSLNVNKAILLPVSKRLNQDSTNEPMITYAIKDSQNITIYKWHTSCPALALHWQLVEFK